MDNGKKRKIRPNIIDSESESESESYVESNAHTPAPLHTASSAAVIPKRPPSPSDNTNYSKRTKQRPRHGHQNLMVTSPSHLGSQPQHTAPQAQDVITHTSSSTNYASVHSLRCPSTVIHTIPKLVSLNQSSQDNSNILDTSHTLQMCGMSKKDVSILQHRISWRKIVDQCELLSGRTTANGETNIDLSLNERLKTEAFVSSAIGNLAAVGIFANVSSGDSAVHHHDTNIQSNLGETSDKMCDWACVSSYSNTISKANQVGSLPSNATRNNIRASTANTATTTMECSNISALIVGAEVGFVGSTNVQSSTVSDDKQLYDHRKERIKLFKTDNPAMQAFMNVFTGESKNLATIKDWIVGVGNGPFNIRKSILLTKPGGTSIPGCDDLANITVTAASVMFLTHMLYMRDKEQSDNSNNVTWHQYIPQAIGMFFISQSNRTGRETDNGSHENVKRQVEIANEQSRLLFNLEITDKTEIYNLYNDIVHTWFQSDQGLTAELLYVFLSPRVITRRHEDPIGTKSNSRINNDTTNICLSLDHDGQIISNDNNSITTSNIHKGLVLVRKDIESYLSSINMDGQRTISTGSIVFCGSRSQTFSVDDSEESGGYPSSFLQSENPLASMEKHVPIKLEDRLTFVTTSMGGVEIGAIDSRFLEPLNVNPEIVSSGQADKNGTLNAIYVQEVLLQQHVDRTRQSFQHVVDRTRKWILACMSLVPTLHKAWKDEVTLLHGNANVFNHSQNITHSPTSKIVDTLAGIGRIGLCNIIINVARGILLVCISQMKQEGETCYSDCLDWKRKYDAYTQHLEHMYLEVSARFNKMINITQVFVDEGEFIKYCISHHMNDDERSSEQTPLEVEFMSSNTRLLSSAVGPSPFPRPREVIDVAWREGECSMTVEDPSETLLRIASSTHKMQSQRSRGPQICRLLAGVLATRLDQTSRRPDIGNGFPLPLWGKCSDKGIGHSGPTLVHDGTCQSHDFKYISGPIGRTTSDAPTGWTSNAFNVLYRIIETDAATSSTPTSSFIVNMALCYTTFTEKVGSSMVVSTIPICRKCLSTVHGMTAEQCPIDVSNPFSSCGNDPFGLVENVVDGAPHNANHATLPSSSTLPLYLPYRLPSRSTPIGHVDMHNVSLSAIEGPCMYVHTSPTIRNGIKISAISNHLVPSFGSGNTRSPVIVEWSGDDTRSIQPSSHTASATTSAYGVRHRVPTCTLYTKGSGIIIGDPECPKPPVGSPALYALPGLSGLSGALTQGVRVSSMDIELVKITRPLELVRNIPSFHSLPFTPVPSIRTSFIPVVDDRTQFPHNHANLFVDYTWTRFINSHTKPKLRLGHSQRTTPISNQPLHVPSDHGIFGKLSTFPLNALRRARDTTPRHSSMDVLVGNGFVKLSSAVFTEEYSDISGGMRGAAPPRLRDFFAFSDRILDGESTDPYPRDASIALYGIMPSRNNVKMSLPSINAMHFISGTEVDSGKRLLPIRVQEILDVTQSTHVVDADASNNNDYDNESAAHCLGLVDPEGLRDLRCKTSTTDATTLRAFLKPNNRFVTPSFELWVPAVVRTAPNAPNGVHIRLLIPPPTISINEDGVVYESPDVLASQAKRVYDTCIGLRNNHDESDDTINFKFPRVTSQLVASVNAPILGLWSPGNSTLSQESNIIRTGQHVNTGDVDDPLTWNSPDTASREPPRNASQLQQHAYGASDHDISTGQIELTDGLIDEEEYDHKQLCYIESQEASNLLHSLNIVPPDQKEGSIVLVSLCAPSSWFLSSSSSRTSTTNNNNHHGNHSSAVSSFQDVGARPKPTVRFSNLPTTPFPNRQSTVTANNQGASAENNNGRNGKMKFGDNVRPRSQPSPLLTNNDGMGGQPIRSSSQRTSKTDKFWMVLHHDIPDVDCQNLASAAPTLPLFPVPGGDIKYTDDPNNMLANDIHHAYNASVALFKAFERDGHQIRPSMSIVANQHPKASDLEIAKNVLQTLEVDAAVLRGKTRLGEKRLHTIVENDNNIYDVVMNPSRFQFTDGTCRTSNEDLMSRSNRGYSNENSKRIVPWTHVNTPPKPSRGVDLLFQILRETVTRTVTGKTTITDSDCIMIVSLFLSGRRRQLDPKRHCSLPLRARYEALFDIPNSGFMKIRFSNLPESAKAIYYTAVKAHQCLPSRRASAFLPKSSLSGYTHAVMRPEHSLSNNFPNVTIAQSNLATLLAVGVPNSLACIKLQPPPTMSGFTCHTTIEHDPLVYDLPLYGREQSAGPNGQINTLTTCLGQSGFGVGRVLATESPSGTREHGLWLDGEESINKNPTPDRRVASAILLNYETLDEATKNRYIQVAVMPFPIITFCYNTSAQNTSDQAPVFTNITFSIPDATTSLCSIPSPLYNGDDGANSSVDTNPPQMYSQQWANTTRQETLGGGINIPSVMEVLDISPEWVGGSTRPPNNDDAMVDEKWPGYRNVDITPLQFLKVPHNELNTKRGIPNQVDGKIIRPLTVPTVNDEHYNSESLVTTLPTANLADRHVLHSQVPDLPVHVDDAFLGSHMFWAASVLSTRARSRTFQILMIVDEPFKKLVCSIGQDHYYHCASSSSSNTEFSSQPRINSFNVGWYGQKSQRVMHLVNEIALLVGNQIVTPTPTEWNRCVVKRFDEFVTARDVQSNPNPFLAASTTVGDAQHNNEWEGLVSNIYKAVKNVMTLNSNTNLDVHCGYSTIIIPALPLFTSFFVNRLKQRQSVEKLPNGHVVVGSTTNDDGVFERLGCTPASLKMTDRHISYKADIGCRTLVKDYLLSIGISPSLFIYPMHTLPSVVPFENDIDDASEVNNNNNYY